MTVYCIRLHRWKALNKNVKNQEIFIFQCPQWQRLNGIESRNVYYCLPTVPFKSLEGGYCEESKIRNIFCVLHTVFTTSSHMCYFIVPMSSIMFCNRGNSPNKEQHTNDYYVFPYFWLVLYVQDVDKTIKRKDITSSMYSEPEECEENCWLNSVYKNGLTNR